ncbi:MAG: excinuclease ABC subunit UvrC [Anaeroplasmataceae bacterium]
MNEDIKLKLELLPNDPGCYLMKNKDNKIIYVGKAKNLKNRVRSYFTGAHNNKTTRLVEDITSFDYIITNSEVESLVLESNLIKQHDPKYNILLTDDKSYPYILLTNDKHPRLLVVRNPKSKKLNGKIFGPYPNVFAARKTCELLNRLYPLRKCNKIPKQACLYYHMHQCLGPCIIDEEFDYSLYKKDITSFLNGNSKEIIKQLEFQMEESSKNLEFEKAIEFRNLLDYLNTTLSDQTITISDTQSKDIIGFKIDEDSISICVLYMRNGKIVQNYFSIFPIVDEINIMIESILIQLYENKSLIPKEIIIDKYIDSEVIEQFLNTKIIIPIKGSKKDLLDLANKNATENLIKNKLLYKNKVLKKFETIESLANLLNIDTPYHIEAFDNSNLFGEYPVSAMVVYKNGKPSKKDYRKYHIKTVKGANDYESMKEVIYRRYLKLKLEDLPFPDLIIMDGATIQVNACLEVLKLLNLNINVIGIKKDINHKANSIIYNNEEYKIEKNSDIYLFISNVSQTVHDFAISFFRSTKVKGMFSSRLDGIKGLGPKKKELILKHFLSIDKISNATTEEFKEIGINEELSNLIKEHLKEN